MGYIKLIQVAYVLCEIIRLLFIIRLFLILSTELICEAVLQNDIALKAKKEMNAHLKDKRIIFFCCMMHSKIDLFPYYHKSLVTWSNVKLLFRRVRIVF